VAAVKEWRFGPPTNGGPAGAGVREPEFYFHSQWSDPPKLASAWSKGRSLLAGDFRTIRVAHRLQAGSYKTEKQQRAS